ncbi:hypothetical protein RFI_38874 [Reticulomyxa filosa]|uniref:Uncharacterized protein n=1 Tax=Reticulomyxa filosa TaxID=46433 RepID=X6LAQ0_RETFI|nr:hypothetical protein RFI_38874 [Reticulomyxa filosa]|eukprot:ETN98618.1 hypothetical protein RFI_38874 [Reticulomyxa filosa]
MYRSDQGCILHFHPSMRRSNMIKSCDVSWISPFKHEREILFARSTTFFFFDEKTHKEQHAWNAKVESEDEYTQMILLTWVKYDQYIQQIMQISAMWNHSIDFNLIYAILNETQGKIDQNIEFLSMFETWKLQSNNTEKYKNKKKKFIERRCCNHQINFFCIFVSEKKFSSRTPIENAKLLPNYILTNKVIINQFGQTIKNKLKFTKKNKTRCHCIHKFQILLFVKSNYFFVKFANDLNKFFYCEIFIQN